MGVGKMIGNEFVDIIEWLQTDSDTIVYRFPRYRNEIKYGAKLTVREGQTAIFVNEGKIADVFPPGIYALQTANLPILSTLQNWHHGFESPFKAEVYFFNTTSFLDQKWGTKQPVMINDPQFGLVRLRAFGTYTLRVDDAETLLKKLVGTDGNFEIDEVNQQITNAIVSQFPAVLASSNIGVLALPTRYSELANNLKQALHSDVKQYGLALGNVLVESISLPENVQQMIDEKTNMTIIGQDMNRYTQMQAAQGMGQGSEGASMASAGVGMAMGMEMGRQMAGAMQQEQVAAPANSSTPSSPSTPPPLEKIYYLMILGERTGPMTISDVYEKLNRGEINAHTLIWRKGMKEWQSIETTNDIDLSHLPPPLPTDSDNR